MTIAQLIKKLEKFPRDMYVDIQVKEPYDEGAEIIQERAEFVTEKKTDYSIVIH